MEQRTKDMKKTTLAVFELCEWLTGSAVGLLFLFYFLYQKSRGFEKEYAKAEFDLLYKVVKLSIDFALYIMRIHRIIYQEPLNVIAPF
jgi:hypothetical protein